MKHFFDCEFIEGFKKPLFGKRRHFIDLISIGIIAEDGSTYYAISNEFNAKDADDWVYKNVIQNIELEWVKSYSGDGRNKILDRIEGKGKYGAIKIMQNEIGKSTKQIAEEIKYFVLQKDSDLDTTKPEFYSYYADYDWVLFCSLFGRMIDLPKGFPMYCNDLKQTFDERLKHQMLLTKETFTGIMERWKLKPNYPKQQNEHNALDDARWNKRFFEYLTNL